MRFLRVLDAIAEAKMRNAVQKCQLRRLCNLFLVFAVLAAVAGGIIALKTAIWIVPFIR